MTRTTDQQAARKLINTLRRFERAVKMRRSRRFPDNEYRIEGTRRQVVADIADLLTEFGLLDTAEAVREQLPEFDGRHIEDDTVIEA